MKKFIIFGLMCCCSIAAVSLEAAQRVRDVRDLDTNCDGCYDPCEVNPCEEYQTGPCTVYCPVTRFKPQYYCEKRYVDEPYCVQKKCTRYVPQYYTKQYCRYVPQYYTKTYCRKVPECYYVTEEKCRKRCVTEQKCRYIPYCAVEKRCVDCPIDNCGQASCNTCGSGAEYAMPQGRGDYQQQAPQQQSAPRGMEKGSPASKR